MKHYQSVIVLFLLLSFTWSHCSAAKTVVSQTALNHIAQQTLVRLFEQVKPVLSVPYVSTTTHVPLIGDFTIEAKDINIRTLEFHNLSLKIMDQGVEMHLQRARANVTFDYTWEKPKSKYLRGNGSIEAVAMVSMNTEIHVTVQEGKLRIRMSEFEMRMDALTMKLQSRFAWLLHILFKVLSPLIRYKIAQRVNLVVPEAVNNILGQLLDQKTLLIPLGKSGLFLDMSVIEFSTKKDEWVSLDQQGLVRTLSKPSPLVSNHSSIGAEKCLGDSMVSLCVHENTFISLFQSLYEAEWITFVITNDNLPRSIPLLNTSWLQAYLPKLYGICPKCALRLVFSPRPTFLVASINQSGILFDWTADLQFQVENPEKKGQYWNVIGLNTSLAFNFALILKEERLSGIISFVDCKVDVQYSKVDEINVENFGRVVSFLAQQAVMPSLNFFLQMGLPLSSPPIPLYFMEQEWSIRYTEAHISLGVNLKTLK